MIPVILFIYSYAQGYYRIRHVRDQKIEFYRDRDRDRDWKIFFTGTEAGTGTKKIISPGPGPGPGPESKNSLVPVMSAVNKKHLRKYEWELLQI